MNVLGNTLIVIALASSLFSIVQYHRATSANPLAMKRARQWLRISTATIVAMSGLLMILLLQHDFSNGYVYSYSSRDLPFHFLISSFYAGQEGSFLFWVLCSALIGLVLRSYTARRKNEPWVMAVYMGVQAFLLLLLFAKTPFISVWEKLPELPLNQLPADGGGLNPLLQNIWMVIHPPVLFVGFAAMAVPFAFAVACMWKREYTLISAQALGWLLFGVFVLGIGIMLGAYWAYGVLGWGGYWGWDPVENSSLVPWIVGVAFVHTLIVQRNSGKFLRLNLALAIASFFLTIYSTFLTRSGILGDSSVHSFTDPGAGVYWLMVVFLLAIAMIGGGFMFIRRKDLRPTQIDTNLMNKETLLASGTLILILMACIILFGTSLPIVGNSTVDVSFYNTMNSPLVVVMLLLIGLTLFAQWKADTTGAVLGRSFRWLLASLAGTSLLFILGVSDVMTLVVVLASLFAILVNIGFVWKLRSMGLKQMGGKLAHIGLGIFLLGVIASGRYDSTMQVALQQDQPQDVLGYALTYVGHHPTVDNKVAFDVKIEKDGSQLQLSPVMFETDRQGTMKNPDIASFLAGDFYLSPISLEQSRHRHTGQDGKAYIMEKGRPAAIGDYKATFAKFEMNAHGESTMPGDGGGMVVGAVLELTDGKQHETITPVIMYDINGRQTFKPVESTVLKATVALVSMNVGGMGGSNTSTVTINIQADEGSVSHRDVFVVEASVKPFISLVWIGTIIMFGGFILAITKRFSGTETSLVSHTSKSSIKRRNVSIPLEV
ncbi:MAG: heme lyase CcmF/NrfE family subunit [Bacteroidota bacterium]